MPWEVETPGDNKKQSIFGAVNTKTGQPHIALEPHKRSQDLQQFFDREVFPCYPETDFRFINVYRSSNYKSKSTKEWSKE